MNKKKLTPAALLLLLLTACNNHPEEGKNTADTTGQVIDSQSGKASFYSRSFDGQETASGEIFDSNELVAAHPSYPLGTTARLTNTENGLSTEVRIIDRGPTKENQREGVIIDVSRAAAKKLNMIEDGRVNIKVEVLEWGKEQQ